MIRFRASCLRMCHFVIWIISSWRQSKTQRNPFTFTLTPHKNWNRSLYQERAIIKDKFLYQKDLSSCPSKHLFTKNLLFSFFCYLFCFHLRPQTSISLFLVSGWYISWKYLTSVFVVLSYIDIKFVFLLVIFICLLSI